jgi:hypothetical protein
VLPPLCSDSSTTCSLERLASPATSSVQIPQYPRQEVPAVFIRVISKKNRKSFAAWNQQDPVDNWERERERPVAKIQGNRNPFVAEMCPTNCEPRNTEKHETRQEKAAPDKAPSTEGERPAGKKVVSLLRFVGFLEWRFYALERLTLGDGDRRDHTLGCNADMVLLLISLEVRLGSGQTFPQVGRGGLFTLQANLSNGGGLEFSRQLRCLALLKNPFNPIVTLLNQNFLEYIQLLP